MSIIAGYQNDNGAAKAPSDCGRVVRNQKVFTKIGTVVFAIPDDVNEARKIADVGAGEILFLLKPLDCKHPLWVLSCLYPRVR